MTCRQLRQLESSGPSGPPSPQRLNRHCGLRPQCIQMAPSPLGKFPAHRGMGARWQRLAFSKRSSARSSSAELLRCGRNCITAKSEERTR